MQSLEKYPSIFLQTIFSLNEEVYQELVARALQYLDIVPKEYRARLVNTIFSLSTRKIYDDLSLKEKLLALSKVQGLLVRGQTRKGKETLLISSQDWICPSLAILYAYIKGYDFVVFSDRRSMSKELTQEALSAAAIFMVFVGSPYYTTLLRDEYAVEESKGEVIPEDEENLLKLLSAALKNVRIQYKRERSFVLTNTQEGVAQIFQRELAQRYAQECIAILRKTCDVLVAFLHKRNILISENDFSIALVGSFSREEATYESDLDFDILAKNAQVADLFEQQAALYLADFLRKVGFDIGPSDELYQSHMKTRYRLKEDRLFDVRMNPEDRRSTLIRFCDYQHTWGSKDVFADFVGNVRGEIIEHYDESLSMMRSAVDEYVEMAKLGHGIFAKRNFVVLFDLNRQVVFDPKWIINVLEIGLREIIIQKLPILLADKFFDLNNMPKKKTDLLKFFYEYDFFNGNGAEKVEKIISAYHRLLEYRQAKAIADGLNTASQYYPGFISDASTIAAFVLEHIVERRDHLLRQHINDPVILNHRGEELSQVVVDHFPDHEIYLRILNDKAIQGQDVVVRHALESSHDLVQVVLLANALRTYEAKSLKLIIETNSYVTYQNGYRYILYYYFDEVFFSNGERIEASENIKINKKSGHIWIDTILYQHARFQKDAQEAADKISADSAKIEIVKVEQNPLHWKIALPPALRGKSIALIHSTENTQDIVELWFILVALRRAQVKNISLVNTYEGYSRQDRIFQPGEGISAKVMLEVIDQLLDRHIALNIHYGGKSGWITFEGCKVYNVNAFVSVAEGMATWMIKELGSIDAFLKEVKNHPILLLGPDDGSFPYVQETMALLKVYLKKHYGLTVDIYCGYMDKTRVSGKKVKIPGYVLDQDKNKIDKINGIDLKEFWCFILDDETSHGSTLFAATFSLVRKLSVAWQRVLAGVIHGKLARGMAPFETGWNEQEIKFAKEPRPEYVTVDDDQD
ncbi:MAG: ribose-phosphate pyrophosphokinase-like domain-containing protein, partial [Candidatus Omnitrophota bacterium]